MMECSVLREELAETSCFSIKFLIFCAEEICCTIFTQQFGAWSKSCVERIVDYLLSFGFLQLLMNLLHYPFTLMCLLVALVWCYT